MSVYTSINHNELRDFLARYRVGELTGYEGIQSGIENTNYFVSTTESEYVLTIFEQHTREELGFFLDLTAFLAEHAIPCAHPARTEADHYLDELKGKPAALVDRLAGASVERPEPAHCTAVGAVLARMHLAGQNFSQRRPNDRGPHWWATTRHALKSRIMPDELSIIEAEIAFQATHKRDALPRGIIHADLFRDNVLFNGETLSGLIDFYYACTDVLLYDVAVTVNDWCTIDSGALDPVRTRAFLAAYYETRPITEAERLDWPVMLRAAALRFWLSRLYDLHFPRPGEMTQTHDPAVFQRILAQHIKARPAELDLWPQTD